MTTTNSSTSTSGPEADVAQEIPYFPAPSLPALSQTDTALALIEPVLTALAEVVELPENFLARPTPCAEYTVGQLRDHVLAWLQFFAAAFADPDAATTRPDPGCYRVADDEAARAGGCGKVVLDSAATLHRALSAGVLQRQVVLSQSRMDAPAALGMVLGEYLVHGWDLARALDRPWTPSAQACAVAREFFAGTIGPEYRGGDGGFFAAEVAVPDDAPELDRLIGFAGRDPRWTPPAAG
jgi:uncharacterized protein (TIGR03086 family)